MSVLFCSAYNVVVCFHFFRQQAIGTLLWIFKRYLSPRKETALTMCKKNRHRSASLTTEAALVFPFFFFIIALFWQLFLLALFELQVGNVITKTAMEYSYLGYANRQQQRESTDISWIYQPLLWNEIPENKRVSDVFVSCEEEDGFVAVKVSYDFLCDAPWVPDFVLPVVQCFRFYPYMGETDPDRFLSEGERKEKEDVVYRTEHGTVYHESKACSYLKVTVRPVTLLAVKTLRNSSGEIYTPCERCDHLELGENVYISAGGNRYHRSASCAALKRNVMELKRTEIGELKACHKCGKQENN